MSATFTTYGRQLMMGALFDPDNFVPIPTLTVALCTDPPATNASIEDLIEPDPLDGYERVDYPSITGAWASSGFAERVTANDIAWPVVIADWGWVYGFAFLDIPNLQTVIVGTLATPFVAVAGMVPTLEAGTVSFGLYD